jgi:hypothetical protein
MYAWLPMGRLVTLSCALWLVHDIVTVTVMTQLMPGCSLPSVALLAIIGQPII